MSDKYCILQDDLKDCGVCCLLSIIKYYGGYVSRDYLREITNTGKNGVSALNLVRSARELGFESYGIKGKIKSIDNKILPVIAHVLIDKKYNHFVVIYKIDLEKKQILIMDPSKGFVYLSFSQFLNITTNYYLFLKPKQPIPKLKDSKNMVLYLIKSVLERHRIVLVCIIIMSFMFTLLNIISSYNFQLLYNEK